MLLSCVFCIIPVLSYTLYFSNVSLVLVFIIFLYGIKCIAICGLLYSSSWKRTTRVFGAVLIIYNKNTIGYSIAPCNIASLLL